MNVVTDRPRPRCRTRRMLAAAGACTVVIALAAGTASAAPNVPAAASPTSWSRNVCTALSSFSADIKKLDQNFSKATQNSKSLAGIKTQYVAFLQHNVSRTSQLITSLKKAGVPAAPNGKQFAAAIQAGYVNLHDGFSGLVGDAKALPADTVANFKTAFTALQAKIQTLETQNQNAFAGADQFQSPVINNAFNTVAACKKLNSSG
jgi:hypothetical protein